MTPEAQLIAIAEACGWTDVGPWGNEIGGYNGNRSGHKKRVPDYLRDLNAMAEAEKALSATQLKKYYGVLVADVIGWGAYGNEHIAIHATAAQRAEAFLRTLNLWTE